MPTATEFEPFKIECPWCYMSVGEEYNDIVLVNFKLTALGRVKLESYSCPFCGEPVGFIIKNIVYKIAKLTSLKPVALVNPEESMTSKLGAAVASASLGLAEKPLEEPLEKP